MRDDDTNAQASLLIKLMRNSEGVRKYIQVRIPPRLRRAISADDIMQEVWVTVVRDVAGNPAHEWDEFDFWLYRIAQRRIADAIRRAGAVKRGGRDRVMHEARRTASLVDLFARLGSPQGTPSMEVSQAEAVDAMQIALAALPEDYRTAIKLRYVDGSSYAEIAQEMSRSYAAVCGLLHRGLRRLKVVMGTLGEFFSDDAGCATPHCRAE